LSTKPQSHAPRDIFVSALFARCRHLRTKCAQLLPPDLGKRAVSKRSAATRTGRLELQVRRDPGGSGDLQCPGRAGWSGRSGAPFLWSSGSNALCVM